MSKPLPASPEGLREMDALDKWWERRFTARYERLIKEYPHLFAGSAPLELPHWSDDLALPELAEDAATMARKFTIARRVPVCVEPIEVPMLPLVEYAGPTRAILEARLAESTRTICEDCGCEEFCVAYLHDALAELAGDGARAGDGAGE